MRALGAQLLKGQRLPRHVGKASPSLRVGKQMIADFRGLKFTHNGSQVLDGVPCTRKLQCEVFSPLSLGIAESYYTCLPGSSARPLEAMMRR
jgi:hypothetical protein